MEGYEDLVPKKSSAGNDYADLVPKEPKAKPRLPSMFTTAPQPEAEAAGSLAGIRGLVSGFLGAPGGMESMITPESKGQYKGQETVFPTPENIRAGFSKLGWKEPEKKELQAAQMAGEFAPVGAQLLTAGVPALGRGLKTALSSGAEMLVGKTTPSVEELARKFESKGFKFEPGQLREKKPLGSPGYSTPQMRSNQALANELTTAETGSKAGFGKVTKEHLEKTQKELGKVYGEIFSKDFQIFLIFMFMPILMLVYLMLWGDMMKPQKISQKMQKNSVLMVLLI